MTVSDQKYVAKVPTCSKKRASICGLFVSAQRVNSLKPLAQRNEININGAKCGGALWSHCQDEYCGVLQSTP